MAQARSAMTTQPAPRVHVIAPAGLGATAIAALRARDIDAHVADRAGLTGDAASWHGDVVGWALEATPGAAETVELAQTCARAARAGLPVCLLVPPSHATGRAAIERAAALAYLRAHGAALAHDVDAWLEALVALVRFGMPRGAEVAVIAPAGSWLEAQALAYVAEAEAGGVRAPVVRPAAARGGAHGDDARSAPHIDTPTDVILHDAALVAPTPANGALHVPVVARPELATETDALHGARAALGAIDLLGRAAERIAVGLGPADVRATAELATDRDQLERQLGKLARGVRVGDHETKVLLRAYGAPITRQAVATTPSAAVKAARKAGYPVELKPWGPDVPTEREGCPVERNVSSDALVRRAYSAVLAASGKIPSQAETGAVIVRETPPDGRDLAVSFIKLPALGWTAILDGPQLAAAPCPLRLADARALAAAVVASRAGDFEPDREGLANLLRRASHLVVDLDTTPTPLARLELPRVVVGGRGSRTVVADAWCQLV